MSRASRMAPAAASMRQLELLPAQMGHGQQTVSSDLRYVVDVVIKQLQRRAEHLNNLRLILVVAQAEQAFRPTIEAPGLLQLVLATGSLLDAICSNDRSQPMRLPDSRLSGPVPPDFRPNVASLLSVRKFQPPRSAPSPPVRNRRLRPNRDSSIPVPRPAPPDR